MTDDPASALDEMNRLQALGLLAAGLAHDLRGALMTQVRGLELLRGRVADLHEVVGPSSGGAGSRAVDEAIAHLRSSVDALLAGAELAARQVLQLQRVHDGGSEGVGRRVADLRRAVRRAIAIVQAGRSGGPEMRLVDPDERCWEAAVDEDALVRVLLNLLLNAVAVMERARPGGRIELCLTGDGDGLVCDVSDDGPGVPDSIIPRLFEPFVSGNPGRGMGLGLAVSRRLLRQAGGDLRLARTGPDGSTFRIRLRPAAG